MPNPFNPVNGAELRVICCKDIGRQLDVDERFSYDQNYRQAKYSLNLKVATFPEDQGFERVIDGSVGKGNGAEVKLALLKAIDHNMSLDDAFRINIGYPKLSITFAMQVTVFPADDSVAVDRGETVRPAQTAPEASTAPVAKDPGSFADANVLDEHKTAEQWGAEDKSDMRPVQKPAHLTSSGLEVTGGAMELPGAVDLIKSAHREANKDLLEGRRVIENPDAARRENQMHVPRPTSVGGGMIADVPAGADQDIF